MSDVHSKSVRSKNMKAIASHDTAPELIVRRLLYNNGYRYRVAPTYIEGKPDIWLKKRKTAIFINGCFWHAHECEKFRWPKTNTDFWKRKLLKNKERDERNIKVLLSQKVRVLIIWECAVSGKKKLTEHTLLMLITVWFQSVEQYAEITSDGLRVFDGRE
ncbi:very short patch repair endonuclease [Pseudoalteromonas sp. T1lg10]|uniref:very short patch repair endonuclease n=1 Tax=Pseudoalteromonas sp. T1lg10 TaxID=2077093 RepID=UPI000CF6EB74|nr:DNA mismatch endonuclease Vsr [Pseudoalteromonas sp. T1lg10]